MVCTAKRNGERNTLLAFAKLNTAVNIKEFDIEGIEEISVTISVGLNSYDEKMEDPSILYKNADKALYVAKETGRNKVVVYKEE